MPLFKFKMDDAWGDDYDITVRAIDEATARHIANTIDDDALADDAPAILITED